MEEPAFYYYYNQALENVNIAGQKTCIESGCEPWR